MGGAPEALVGDMNRTVICDFVCSGNVPVGVPINRQRKSRPDLLYHFTETRGSRNRIDLGMFAIYADKWLFSLALFHGLLLGLSLALCRQTTPPPRVILGLEMTVVAKVEIHWPYNVTLLSRFKTRNKNRSENRAFL